MGYYEGGSCGPSPCKTCAGKVLMIELATLNLVNIDSIKKGIYLFPSFKKQKGICFGIPDEMDIKGNKIHLKVSDIFEFCDILKKKIKKSKGKIITTPGELDLTSFDDSGYAYFATSSDFESFNDGGIVFIRKLEHREYLEFEFTYNFGEPCFIGVNDVDKFCSFLKKIREARK